jgi:hypothetical protein
MTDKAKAATEIPGEKELTPEEQIQKAHEER